MATTERVTVTLPSQVVKDIDRVESNRSRFIVVAVRHELDRRRREELNRSLRKPHPALDSSRPDSTNGPQASQKRLRTWST